MKVQRLGWAGAKITTAGLTILIDAIEDYSGGKFFIIDTIDAQYRFSDEVKADYIMITHLHRDHYDKEVILKVLKPGGKVIASSMIADVLAADGVPNILPLELNESFTDGDVSITPVFAMDGIGDKQVSWVVADGKHRILHGGDTIWHNQFWAIGRQYQSFDAVLLPVNGTTMYFTNPFSPVPGTLTPLQAVTAAHILHAGTLIPIHYGFNKPGVYEEFPDVVGNLKAAATEQNVNICFLQPGEEIAWN
ncbi:MBL fold metallo-hydrolase [Chitinophaga sp. Cy-1792]|uniref:MBL fold metallo-hydrolase n=1 Tax=Chitinophaga sp. Cy-1792 TaxID=2608339 RepID=UPI0014227434|nr:MBL fold metallo-hydrolase [Chitinophaga sp. Cy-1792]NIG55886.1 MBL fold metallo-hydrolase [Chitinophaga sp. Cy-1792]